MMHKAHLYVLIGVMLLLSVAVSILTTADINSGYPCGQDADCAELAEDPSQVYYCHPAEGTCYLQEELETIAPPEEESLPPPEPTLEDRIAQVHAEIYTLQDSIDTTKTTSSNIQDRLTTIEQKLASIESSSKTAAQQFTAQGKAVETGLTGLQKEVNETKKEVSAVGESSRLIKYVFFILLIAAITLGLIYYVNRKPPSSVHPHVLAYITKHIKEGKKFSFIKESLQKAGWAEEEIARAYTETVKQNYERYAQQRAVAGTVAGKTGKPGALAAARPAESLMAARAPPAATMRKNQNKVIGIAVVTILLLLGVFFLLSGTVGKAVFYQQEVLEKTREITQKIECTLPHILTPDGDACCRDENSNAICDTTEERGERLAQGASGQLSAAGQCTDNLQCESDEYCLDGRCSPLSTTYKKDLSSSSCGRICDTYYALVVSTSDKETYNVKPKRGSYSCAGALEWKIMENIKHCQSERAVVPIMIIMKEPGKVLSEQVITLQRRESKEVQHPTLPNCKLGLTIEEIYELCEE